jgi:hypothetical protein
MPIIALPPNLPAPKYQFGQQVQWPAYRGELRWGIIRGLQYFTPSMSAALFHSLEWVGWSYLVEVDRASCHLTDIEDVHEDELEIREGSHAQPESLQQLSGKFFVKD